MPDNRRAFHAELDEIQAELLRLGGRVAEAIARGTEALLTSDTVAAEELIVADDELDEMRNSVEDHIYTVMALQQPILSTDLRLVITALRMAHELERSGDLVVNIAKGVRRIAGTPIAPKTRGLIDSMSHQAQSLFRRALDAYSDHNAVLATSLDTLDDELDDLHRQFLESIFELEPTDRTQVQCLVQLALIGRFYERIGDHAVNVGEWVSYLVTGLMHEPQASPG